MSTSARGLAAPLVKVSVDEVANVQRAVKAAATGLGLDTVVTPHVLRHAYATHAMDRGAGIHDVQAALGHVSLDTTAGYLHAHAARVASPLATMIYAP